jgi:surfactin synthase thioesterase subunit
VLLWGHSSGAALAIETARRLEQLGQGVDRVFLAAALLGDAETRRDDVAGLTRRTDAEIAAALGTTTGAFAQLDDRSALALAAAFRHDCVAAHHYFLSSLDAPPSARLSAPATVVVAGDDPLTAGARRRHLDWQLLARHVDLLELPDGGHYFVRTRPSATALAVLRAIDPQSVP